MDLSLALGMAPRRLYKRLGAIAPALWIVLRLLCYRYERRPCSITASWSSFIAPTRHPFSPNCSARFFGFAKMHTEMIKKIQLERNGSEPHYPSGVFQSSRWRLAKRRCSIQDKKSHMADLDERRRAAEKPVMTRRSSGV